MAEGRDKRVDLRGAPIDIVRAAIAAVCEYACNGTAGAFQGAPVFDEVTEGRQDATDKARARNPRLAAYSACTDLVSYLAEAIGVESEALVNRNDDGGSQPWKIGGGPAFIQGNPGWLSADRHDVIALAGQGDALVILDSWHVCVVDSVDVNAGTIAVFEYGQFDPKSGKAYGRKNTHPLKRVGRDWTVKGRKVAGIIPASAWPITGIARLPDDFEAAS